MTNEKPKEANDMTDEELMLSVFPGHVLERIRREHGLEKDDPEAEEEEDLEKNDDLTTAE